MICSNCKKEISDGSKFCEFCGTKVEVASQPTQGAEQQASSQPEQPTQGAEQQVPPQSEQPTQGAGQQQVPPQVQAKPKKPINKKALGIAIAIGAAALFVLILVIGLVVTHKKTIDLQDYTKVTFSGYDGYGVADLEFDHEKFLKDIKEYGKIDNIDEKDLTDGNWADALEDSVDVYDAIDEVSYELNKTNKLSNGDKVKVKFVFDNDKAGKIGLKFKGEDEEFEVKGLDKVKTVDPFQYLTVTFTGTSPNASIDLSTDSSEDFLDSIHFEADNSSGIAKGDTVTVTAEADKDYLLESYGCELKETTKEYTCEDVDEYITKYEDISEEYLETIKKQTEDVLQAYFAEESTYIKAGKLTFEGCYFLSNKDTAAWSSHNILEVVYSTTVKSKDKSFKQTKVYIPVEFTDIQRYADGKYYVNLESWERKGTTDLNYDWYKQVCGYTKIDNMYNELVAARKADYTEESSDNLK